MEHNISWPGWEVVRVLGRGGFGTVYEIQREIFGKTERAALKVLSIPENDDEIQQLRQQNYDDASITEYFSSYLKDTVREYSVMLDLKGHTNVVYCDELRYIQHPDRIGWDIYIKMELLTPLKAHLSKDYDEEQVLRLGIDICRALILCKMQKIVHRDIKPENIFISRSGDYKLGDFGVAKISDKTASGTKVGTYAYMAPEVYKGQAYGSTADIYSLGLVLYWMMNERLGPFLNPSGQIPTVSQREEARSRRFNGEPLPPPKNGSAALKKIVKTACAYHPKDRYTSAEKMLHDLQAILEDDADKTVQDTTHIADTTIVTTKKKPPHLGLWLGICALVILIGLVIGLPSRSRNPGAAPDLQNPPSQTDAPAISDPDMNLTETLQFQDGSYMEIYCDAKGLPVASDYYTKDGTLEYHCAAQYDASGNQIGQQVFWQGAPFSETTWAYDENNEIIQEILKGDGGTVLKRWEYQRNEAGHVLQLEIYGQDDVLLSRTEYQVSDLGIMSSISYDGQGNVTSHTQRTYNNRGLLDQAATLHSDGIKYVSHYNENGDLILSESYDENGDLQYRNTYTLDENGLRIGGISSNWYSDGELLVEEEYFNDRFGNNYRVIHTESGAPSFSSEYVMAIDGTWLKHYSNMSSGYVYETINSPTGNAAQRRIYENGVLTEWSTFTCDNAGNILETFKYDGNDNYLGHETCLYDDLDNLLNETTYDADGNATNATQYVYDGAGTLEEIHSHWYGETGSSYTVYDSNWNTLSNDTYDAEGNLTSRTEYDRDENGLALQYRNYTEGNVLCNYEVYSYNSSNQLIKTEYYDGSGYLMQTETSEYNDLGRVIRNTWYDASGNVSHWTEITYREDGQEDTETTYSSDGSVSSRMTYIYDENGFLVDIEWD